MNYLASDKIHIFPIGDRSETEDRLLSEKNLTNVFKGLTSKDSYVLSYEDKICKFVLEGYYVEASDIEDLIEENQTCLYATLNFAADHVLEGDNPEEEKFEGVEFTSSPSTTSTSLLLLTKDLASEEIEVPKESYFKYSGDLIYFYDANNEVSLDKHIDNRISQLENKLSTSFQDQIDTRFRWKRYPSS